jgi:hypothetical protein
METKFLITAGTNTPVVVCEKHAQAFETLMIEQEVPHTILELDLVDTPKHCHACDLVIAKDYAERMKQAQPRIILPGEYNG